MMAGDDDDDLVPGGDEDGEGVGPPDAMAKGLVPSSFHRPFLAAGHQANRRGEHGPARHHGNPVKRPGRAPGFHPGLAGRWPRFPVAR